MAAAALTLASGSGAQTPADTNRVPSTLDTVAVSARRDIAAPRAQSMLTKGDPRNALFLQYPQLIGTFEGLSKTPQRDFPLGTVFYRFRVPLLFRTDENFSLSATLPSFNLDLHQGEATALQPAADVPISVVTDIRGQRQLYLSPLRAAGAIGHNSKLWRAGGSYELTGMPAALRRVVPELQVYGNGPKLHGIIELGRERCVTAEGFVNNLSSAYDHLFGVRGFSETNHAYYALLRADCPWRTLAVEATASTQFGQTITQRLDEQDVWRTAYQAVRMHTVDLALHRTDARRIQLRGYSIEKARGSSVAQFGGLQAGGALEQLVGSTLIRTDARVDAVDGGLHPSGYLSLQRPIGGVILSASGGFGYDPITPERLNDPVTGVAALRRISAQRSARAVFGVRTHIGSSDISLQVEPAVVHIPWASSTTKLSGTTIRATGRWNASHGSFAIAGALRSLDLSYDSTTGPVPGSAAQEIKAVYMVSNGPWALSSTVLLRNGVHFPGEQQPGETLQSVNLGRQLLFNVGVTLQGEHAGATLNWINLLGLLGVQNNVAAVIDASTRNVAFIKAPSLPLLALHLQF